VIHQYFRLNNHKKILTLQSLGNFDEVLSKHIFIRIHKSYIVNKSKVTTVLGNTLEIDNVTLPIGVTYLELFKANFK
jgi:two-component system, LytTR family, response regulator